MSLVPSKFPERVTFYENHIEPFTTNALAIGITTAEAADLATKTAAARAALTAREVAAQAAENATVSMRDAIDAMSTAGAALIKKIRAKAEQVGNNSVYPLASIPPPAIPSPAGRPGTPSQFKAQLNPDGSLTFKWSCDNPVGTSGTIYQIFRRPEGSTEETYLGGCGGKEFTDVTIPPGSTSLIYSVQAVRSTAVGVFGQFNVSFGTPSGALVKQMRPKMAA